MAQAVSNLPMLLHGATGRSIDPVGLAVCATVLLVRPMRRLETKPSV